MLYFYVPLLCCTCMFSFHDYTVCVLSVSLHCSVSDVRLSSHTQNKWRLTYVMHVWVMIFVFLINFALQSHSGFFFYQYFASMFKTSPCCQKFVGQSQKSTFFLVKLYYKKVHSEQLMCLHFFLPLPHRQQSSSSSQLWWVSSSSCSPSWRIFTTTSLRRPSRRTRWGTWPSW